MQTGTHTSWHELSVSEVSELFPNVIITGHQVFFTREALENIAATTIENITRFEQGQALGNHLTG
jgi:lactate dehydrogenase-like 2-hydroxyacid dehydrogenase